MAKTTNKLKTFAIIGAGALGSFYGAKLANKGYQIQFQSKFLSKHLGKSLLQIESIWGDFSIEPDLHAFTQSMFTADVIIVATKLIPNIDYFRLLSPLFKKEVDYQSIIVCLQNGINQEEKLSKIFPKAPILGALAFTSVYRKSYKKVCHIDYGQITLAPLKEEDLPIAKRLGQLFNECGIQSEVKIKLREIRWHKLIWNIPFNPLSVILEKATTFDMLKNFEICTLIESIMQEVVKIAYSDGVLVNEEYISDIIKKTKEMKPYRTSMAYDYEHDKEMEIEAILGEPLKIAQINNVETPIMKVLYQLLSYKNTLNK